MPFTPKAWADGSGGDTPITAAELIRIETAIAKVWDRTGGVVNFDDPSFAGASDDAIHVAGWNYARNATRKPVMQYPDRTFGPLSTPIAAFSGMRAIGPIGMDGVKNLELNSGNYVNHKVSVTTGTGTSSLFVQSGDLSDVGFANIAFSGNASSQWWHNTNGTTQSIYPAHFHSLSFDGFLYDFGNTTQKFTTTQGVFSGHWTVLNYSGTPFRIGGSDCFFLWYLNSNSPASVSGAGKPILWFDYMEKCLVLYPYLTAENDWVGLRVTGGVDRAIRFVSGVYEGRAAGNPATRAVIDLQGGRTIFYGPDLGYVVPTNTNGVITQSGGVTTIYDAHYRKATSADSTLPMLYQTGGIARIITPMAANGDPIYIRETAGSTKTFAYPTANSYVDW